MVCVDFALGVCSWVNSSALQKPWEQVAKLLGTKPKTLEACNLGLESTQQEFGLEWGSQFGV